MLNESVPGEAIGGVIRGDAGLGVSTGRDREIAEVKAPQRGGQEKVAVNVQSAAVGI